MTRGKWLKAPRPDPSILLWIAAIASAAGWIAPMYALLVQLLALAAMADTRPEET
jgi:hypothetical protein